MKKVVVIGLAKSGISSARLLAERGDEVFISDADDSPRHQASLESLIKEGVVKPENSELGSHSEELIKKASLMVVSPGVKDDSPSIKIASENKIPVISEIELAYSECRVPVIAVTGTSGKTTVTTLIGMMLSRSGKDAVVCGNIGNPFSGEIKRLRSNSVVVLETSSFQLKRIDRFRPRIAVILNVSVNHLDWHKDMDEYITSKFGIFRNQREEDVLFLNGKDPILRDLAERDGIKSRIEFFDEYARFSERFGTDNDNYLAAMSVAKEMGVDEDIAFRVVCDFKGIEHRLEHVATVEGVDFINDSKATTVSSVAWALKSLEGRILLIMGGRYKGGDFSLLRDFIEKKVAKVIAIGEARKKIKDDIAPFKDVIEEGSLEGAVDRAFRDARKGDKIVLSPGCSSFDMFSNYKERGKLFRDISVSYEKRRS